MSYHDLHITTAKIKRTSIFDLPYGLELRCTRTRGWTLWDNRPKPLPDHWLDRVAGRSGTGVCIAEEFGRGDTWLMLDVGGYVILDSRISASSSGRSRQTVQAVCPECGQVCKTLAGLHSHKRLHEHFPGSLSERPK